MSHLSGNPEDRFSHNEAQISSFFAVGVSIEMSLSKDQTLTVVCHGREDEVKKARREVMTKLQTQVKVFT